jgi:hypothetical protein
MNISTREIFTLSKPAIFQIFNGQILPQPRDEWRITPKQLGEINGLPHSRGFRVASNGIFCAIQREDGTLFLGHDCHFTAEAEEKVDEQGSPRQPRLSKKVTLEELDNLLTE